MKKTNFFKSSLMILFFAIGLTSAWGQMTFTTGAGITQSQNFDGLPTTNTNNTLTAAVIGQNWYRVTGTTQTQPLNALMVVTGINTGSLSHGVYNCASSASSTDRAIGAVGSGSGVHTIGVQLVNNTGGSLTGFDISGAVEKYRNGSNTVVERVIFEYSVNASNLHTGTWTAVSALDLIEPSNANVATTAAVDGNATENRSEFDGNITLASNLANGGSIWIRWRDTDASGTDALLALDDVLITALTPAVVYENGAWSATPTINDDVIIRDYLYVGSGSEDSFEAKSITVEYDVANSIEGALYIETGYSVTVAGKITNEAPATEFVVESGASLVQTADFTGVNEGAITVIRESNSMVRNDNTQWSSPVENQSLRAFSSETLYNRFWTYNEGTNLYQSLFATNADDAVFAKGAGYSIRVRNTLPTGQTTTHLGTFVGVPFNGDVTVNVTTATDGFNIVGNPYASNINVDGTDGFLGVNPNVEALYFWTHEYPVGSPSYGDNYDSYTRVGSTNVTNPDLQTISVGQGFLVKVAAGTSQVNFNNAMRTADAATFFKNGDDVEKHRIWLSLSTEDNAKLSTTLVGYMTGATNDYDQQIDGKSLHTEFSSIYNVLSNGNFAIQGRALPFEDTDVVSLGFKTIEAGKFIISLSNFDGLFSEGNVTIYLKDNQLNVTHNLMDGAYTFEAGQGEFNERFQIVYETEEVMGSEDLTAGSVQIYKQGQNIVVNSKTEKILSVELFDLSGRNIHRNNKVNNNTYEIKSNAQGVLVVRVLTQNGEVVTKKVINN